MGTRWRALGVGAALLALAIAHFVSAPHATAWHDFLFKATYLPLILAGLWFGLKGAVLASGVTCGVYMVHIFGQLAGEGHHELWSILSDVVLFTVMSFTAGFLSDRHDRARREAEARAADLAETTRVLLQAEEHLRRSERLRFLGEIAAGMAHEIRNPLGGIKGAGEILARPDTPPEERAEFTRVLMAEIERLDRVAGNFLRFGRPSGGGRRRLKPADTVREVMLLLRNQPEGRSVDWSLEGDQGLELETEPDLLRQVLLNVCLNAVQAMEGRGRLVVRLERGPPAAVEVADTGPGIPEELQETLFEPFVTTKVQGTGLGLATARRLMAPLGGRLEVVRTGPGGTVMRLVFDE